MGKYLKILHDAQPLTFAQSQKQWAMLSEALLRLSEVVKIIAKRPPNNLPSPPERYSQKRST